MPIANPESSFESAARHLMRHLCNVEELKRNPLVSSFFVRRDAIDDDAVVAELHDRVLQISNALCEVPSATGKERAKRRHAILAALCAGDPPSATAAQLGVSIHHYYRERRAIGTLVGRALSRERARGTPSFTVADCGELLLARAVLLRDQGLAGQAMRALKPALSERAGCLAMLTRSEASRALLALGEIGRAKSMLVEAVGANTHEATNAESSIALQHCALTQILIDFETGEDIAAGAQLEQLARLKMAENCADEEALDAIIRCGEWHCLNGDFAEGRKLLSHAHDIRSRLRSASGGIEAALALLAAHCTLESRNEFGLEYQWLAEALRVSVAHGSTTGTLDSLAGLMQYRFSVGHFDETHDIAVRGLQIAQETEGNQLLSLFILHCGYLLRTRRWRSVIPLMFESEGLFIPGSLKWALLRQFQSMFLLRCGKFEEARITLSPAYDAAKRIGNRWLEGMLLRDLAIARHRSGEIKGGQNEMREALDLIEGRASILSLWTTYDAAGRVLSDQRLIRRAKQLKATLAASANVALPKASYSHDLNDGALAMPFPPSERPPDSRLRLRIESTDH